MNVLLLIVTIGVPLLVLYMIGKFIIRFTQAVVSGRSKKQPEVSINISQTPNSRVSSIRSKNEPVYVCDQCGAPAKDGATYCMYCGALLNSNYFKNEELSRQKEFIELEKKRLDTKKHMQKERTNLVYFLVLMGLGIFFFILLSLGK